MTELLPCPFCGARIMRVESSLSEFPFIVCENNHAWCPRLDTEAEAIAAWNTRYHSEFEKTVIKAWKEIKAYTERTCKAEYRSGGYGIGGWYCSSCGGYMHDDLQQDMAYCPSCGAKVVEQ